jgi:LysM repeat protein
MRLWAQLLAIAFLLTGLAGQAEAAKRRKYVIEKGDTPISVAQKFDVPVDELLRFNGLKPGSFRAGEKIEIPHKGEVTGKTYVVQPGDSVAKVADFHGVSQSALRSANGMKKSDPLRVGKKIVIPMGLRGGSGRSQVVRKGDTLASIAKKHKVSVKGLAVANKLKPDSPLKLGRTLLIPDEDDLPDKPYKPIKTNKLVKSGEKIPGGVRHAVQPGQSLWTIARAYNVKGVKIAKYNGFSIEDPLSVGQRIVIPGATEVVPVRIKGFAIQPVRFVRALNGETAKLRLMTKSGKVSPSSRRKLSKLAGAKKGKHKVKLLHPRLIHMLQRVAERWPGHTFEIISGYRPGQSGRESKHSQARALDFRVIGIDNKEVWGFCKQLPKSGCGYYPNTTFIHMDARDKSTFWIDRSGPGEKPKYVKKTAKKKTQPSTAATGDEQ